MDPLRPALSPPGLLERLIAAGLPDPDRIALWLLPLMVGLAGGLSTWILLEVLRSRWNLQHRPGLPGRPPIWVPPSKAPRPAAGIPAPVPGARVGPLAMLTAPGARGGRRLSALRPP